MNKNHIHSPYPFYDKRFVEIIANKLLVCNHFGEYIIGIIILQQICYVKSYLSRFLNSMTKEPKEWIPIENL